MGKYKLINPFILGTFQTSYEAKSVDDAAKNLWNNFSKHLTNNVPVFAFTMMDENNGQLTHFLLKEDMKDGKVNYTLSDFSVSASAKAISKLNDEFHRLSAQFGGKKHRYDDNDEDVEEDDEIVKKFKKIRKLQFKHLHEPIVYMKYYPTFYHIDDIYIPTFVVPVTPYIEINFSTAFWG